MYKNFACSLIKQQQKGERKKSNRRTRKNRIQQQQNSKNKLKGSLEYMNIEVTWPFILFLFPFFSTFGIQIFCCHLFSIF